VPSSFDECPLLDFVDYHIREPDIACSGSQGKLFPKNGNSFHLRGEAPGNSYLLGGNQK
jgi:hypothetical protein